uniref:Snake toxin/toxin-like domain-containing protein n=1 Tax=Romanomermis culicivorax TaxID=13658 RepID=A0A915JMF5_ROMCU
MPVIMISVTFDNGAFYEIRRDCEDKCHPRCITDGYGLSMKTCTFCCDFDRCNNRTDRILFDLQASAAIKTFSTCEILAFLLYIYYSYVQMIN